MYEKGLPGYDSWLDNHGSPGMSDPYDEPEWALSEAVDITQTDEGTNDATYRVERVSTGEHVNLNFEAGGTLLFNEEYIETESFICYVGLIDEYHDLGGAVGKTIRLEPSDG